MSRTCWSCDEEVGASLVCNACHKVQPPLDLNPFDRFEIPSHPSVDQGNLRKKYLEMQAALHPDRFVSKTKEEELYARQQSEAFNNAFVVLKDPTKCLESLLKGEKLPPDDPETLMEVMDLYDQIDSLSDKDDLCALEQKTSEKRALVLGTCIKAFEETNKKVLLQDFKKLQFFEKILITLKEKIHRLS